MRPSHLPGPLAGYQSRLVQALDVAKSDVDKARAEEKAVTREEARARRAATGREAEKFSAEGIGCSPLDLGAESVCLQSSTVKYLRDKINAEEFHEEMLKKYRGADSIIAKVARGMPEDKSWALMDAHRKWKREERLNKKRSRDSRRARTVSRRREGSTERSASQGDEGEM